MKYYKLLILVALLLFAMEPQAQVKLIGNEDNASANELSVDGKDNIFASGNFAGNLVVDDSKLKSNGQKDIFLASFNENLKTRWVKSLGGENNEYANALYTNDNGMSHLLMTYEGKTTIGDITLEASGSKDVMMIKFGPSGKIINASSLFITGNPMGEDLIVDNTGDHYILLKFVDEIEIMGDTFTPFETEENGRLLIKTNEKGGVIWMKQLNGIHPESRTVLKLGPQNTVYVGGTFSRALEIGETYQVANGNSDAFIAKFDSYGKVSWVRRSRGEGAEAIRDLGIATDGSIYATGYFTQEATFKTEKRSAVADSDIFLVKYAADGDVRWLRAASGGFQDDKSSNLIVGNNDNVYLTGKYTDGITFYDKSIAGAAGSEIFIASYATDGLVKSLKRAGGSGMDRGIDIEVLSNDELVTYGEFTKVASFGGEKLKSLGETDLYLWKF